MSGFQHFTLDLPDSEAWNEGLLNVIATEAVEDMAAILPLTESDIDAVKGGAILGATKFITHMLDLGLLKGVG